MKSLSNQAYDWADFVSKECEISGKSDLVVCLRECATKINTLELLYQDAVNQLRLAKPKNVRNHDCD